MVFYNKQGFFSFSLLLFSMPLLKYLSDLIHGTALPLSSMPNENILPYLALINKLFFFRSLLIQKQLSDGTSHHHSLHHLIAANILFAFLHLDRLAVSFGLSCPLIEKSFRANPNIVS